jgi:hypothetical protein
VDAVWRRGVPESLYLAIELPQLNVMPIDELLGQPDCFRFILAIQVHSICDVPVWTYDVCLIGQRGADLFRVPRGDHLGRDTSRSGHSTSWEAGAAKSPTAFTALSSRPGSQAQSMTLHAALEARDAIARVKVD